MSFEVQGGSSTCGLASLRYAFSLLGAGLRRNRELEEDDLRILARKSSWKVFQEGTCEDDLRRAANKLGLMVRVRRFYKRDPDAVLEQMRVATEKGHPCIVCVHDDDDAFFHWIVVASVSEDWAVVFDPATTDADLSESTYWLADTDADLCPGLMRISRLKAWIDTPADLQDEIVETYGGEHHCFLEVSVAPDRRREFTPGMIDEETLRLMRCDNDLAASFDQYIDDLRDIFGAPPWNGAGQDREPAHRFIERNRGRIDKLLSTWVLSEFCSRDDLDLELQNLVAISRSYRFSVAKGDEEHTWANLTFYLGWWAATCAHRVEKFEE
jgi:hypothetical protein